MPHRHVSFSSRSPLSIAVTETKMKRADGAYIILFPLSFSPREVPRQRLQQFSILCGVERGCAAYRPPFGTTIACPAECGASPMFELPNLATPQAIKSENIQRVKYGLGMSP